MEDASHSTSIGGGGVRERPAAKPLHLHGSDDARQKVIDLNEQEAKDHEHGPKRTYGRTPDGTGTLTWRRSHGARHGSPRLTQ
jgi:phosphatidylethanolamine N-methyltransferase